MSHNRVMINRRHPRVQRLLGHVLHTIKPHLKEGASSDVARELEDLFWASGVDIITEGMRMDAGLPARDHNGMTLEELKIIETRLMSAMLQPAPTLLMTVDDQGNIGAEPIKHK